MSSNPYLSQSKNYGITKLHKLNQDISFQKKEQIYIKEQTQSLSLIKIVFTDKNIFILLSNGEIYSRGNGDCLGRKSTQNINEDKLNKIIFFKNYNYYSLTKEPEKIIIYEISTGNNHVICLDNENNLWGWGDNSYDQVNPNKVDEKKIYYPSIIHFPKSNLKIFNIFTPRNSTIVVTERNYICSWGEINKKSFSVGGHNNNKNEGGFLIYEDATNLINDSMFKDTSDYRDAFIRARQLIYKGYSFSGGDDEDFKKRLQTLNDKIKKLKKEIEDKEKESKIQKNLFQNLRDKKALIDLVNLYEQKIEKIVSEKENYRNKLALLEEEITNGNNDIKSNFGLLDEVEKNIEDLYNEIERDNENEIIESKYNDSNNIKNGKNIEKDNYEKQRKLQNKEILKENLIKNLDIISKNLEDKEKKKNVLLNKLSSISQIESEYMGIRTTLDEMIKVINEMKGKIKFEEIKIKDTTDELFKKNEILDSITIVKLNEKYPYKTITDLLHESNKELEKINQNIKNMENSSSSSKDNLDKIYEMIKSKIDLISQQNKMIFIIYIMLSSLKDSDIRQYFKDKLKGVKETEENLNFDNNIEFIYKNIIINLLRETYMYINEVNLLQNVSQKFSKKEQKDYILKKINEEKIIKNRDPKNLIENIDIYDNVKTFDNKSIFEKNLNSIPKSKSTWSWNDNSTYTPNETQS